MTVVTCQSQVSVKESHCLKINYVPAFGKAGSFDTSLSRTADPHMGQSPRTRATLLRIYDSDPRIARQYPDLAERISSPSKNTELPYKKALTPNTRLLALTLFTGLCRFYCARFAWGHVTDNVTG